LADIQAAKKERQAYEKHSLGFIKNHFMNRYHNVVTVSEDVVYYCFVDAIEASIKFSQIEAINNRWQNSIDLLEAAQKFKDSDIITEKRLESDKKKALQLYDELIKQGESETFQKETLEVCKATVEAFCLGKTMIQIDGQSCPLIDFLVDGIPSFVPAPLGKKFKQIIQRIRTPMLQNFKSEIAVLSANAGNRYKSITFELIKDEAHAINCLADAIDVMTQLDILFSEKGDISEASLTKKCKNLTATLAKPIFSQPLTNKSQIVMSFDFNSSPINIVDAICSWIEESQNSGEADRVRSRLDAVIKSLQVK